MAPAPIVANDILSKDKFYTCTTGIFELSKKSVREVKRHLQLERLWSSTGFEAYWLPEDPPTELL
jgi:hypothetical protein